MIAIDETGEKIILGRGVRTPKVLHPSKKLINFSEKVPRQVLFGARGIHRARGVVRGRGGARNVGGGRRKSVGRHVPLRAVLGAPFRTQQLYDTDRAQPFPANLMVGFYARADSTQPIRLDLDNELMGAYPSYPE
jgi:hypothetical protein